MSVLGPQEDRGLDGVVLAGRYRIEKRLGAGGMGEVYRAVNTVIDRPVAIKVLHRELTRNAEIVERFLREAKAAIIVRHPNVVDVLDVLEHDGVPFIVQELLNGKDLAKYVELSGGSLGVDEALPLLIPAIEAVGLAHSKGVVHRDIKPENVFLHEVEGQVIPKVLDFGISKLSTPDGKRMTSTGVAMGTPAYMSPEQIQGSAAVDARGDVWSWGIVLFEVLSGRLPFEAETSGALFVQICTTVPARLDTVVQGLPSSLVDVVEKCLRPNREERYANGTELARALRAVLAERGVDSTKKLQAIGPAIIEALESKGALDASPAFVTAPPVVANEQKTAVARRPAVAKATEKATPSALAESEVERELSAQPTPVSKSRASVVVIGAALMVAGFVGAIGVKAMGGTANTANTANTVIADAGVAALVEDSGVLVAASAQSDAASAAVVQAATQSASEDAAVQSGTNVVADNAVDAGAIDDPNARDPRGRRHSRNGTRSNGTTTATTDNSATQQPSNTATTASNPANGTHGTNGTTITTVSGRTTHAATQYEP